LLQVQNYVDVLEKQRFSGPEKQIEARQFNRSSVDIDGQSNSVKRIHVAGSASYLILNMRD
jgi:hypothetical protein